jgi:hypothetical protein
MTGELIELAARVLIVCVSVTWLAIVWWAVRNPLLGHFSFLGFITTRDGYPDRVAFAEMTVLLAMTTWGSIMVLRDQMSEWFVTAFVLTFVLRGAHAAYLKAVHPLAPGSSSTTSTSTTSTTATAAGADIVKQSAADVGGTNR